MLNVAIVGGYDETRSQDEVQDVRFFLRSLVKQLIGEGHNVLGAAQTLMDKGVAEAVSEEVAASGGDLRERLISWVGRNASPSHQLGRLVKSQRLNWDPASSIRGVPEPIERADVVVFIQGYEGTRRAYFWSDLMRKPIIPVAFFGGAAEEIYEMEISRFMEKYSRRMRKLDYEQLNEVGNNFDHKAMIVAQLIDHIAYPKKVTAVMAYSARGELIEKLNEIFNTYRTCCASYGYVCDRVSHMTTDGRINEEIRNALGHSAFIIVDLTDLKNNVMYELGYAEGLGKSLIVTAAEGTNLPFDINDLPVIFWRPDAIGELENDLLIKISQVAQKQGRKPVANDSTHRMS